MNDIVSTQDQLHPIAATPAQMLMVAIEKNADLDKLEKLMDLQERWEAGQAEKAYWADMAVMQKKLPIIDRKGQIVVNKEVRSTFAKYEDIKEAIAPIMSKHGFSSGFKTSFQDGCLTIVGTISHKDGHQESTPVVLPFDTSGSKNAVQAVGSSIQYGKRYALCMLLDIATGGDDDDAQSTDDKSAIEKKYNYVLRHNVALRENLSSVLCIKENISLGELSTAKEAWNELPEETQNALWVAPTYGGVLTTGEREMIKSKAWIDA